MDAEVARKRVEKAMGPAALKQEIDKVLKKIKVACDMGNSYVYVSNIGNTANEYIAICNYLKSLGYEVIKKKRLYLHRMVKRTADKGIQRI